jgi:hypothetical protein
MAKYRKKPVVIDAFRFNGTVASLETIKLIYPDMKVYSLITQGKNVTLLKIGTLEGSHIVGNDDYIIRGIAGEYYPCKPAIFAATYEFIE